MLVCAGGATAEGQGPTDAPADQDRCSPLVVRPGPSSRAGPSPPSPAPAATAPLGTVARLSLRPSRPPTAWQPSIRSGALLFADGTGHQAHRHRRHASRPSPGPRPAPPSSSRPAWPSTQQVTCTSPTSGPAGSGASTRQARITPVAGDGTGGSAGNGGPALDAEIEARPGGHRPGRRPLLR